MNNHLNQRFEIKATNDEDGTFVAYGNVFNVIDQASDVTVPGAFSNTIANHKANGTMPKFLAQHGHTTMPIGIITDMVEDDKGLRFEGKFALETQAGREAYSLVKMTAIDEFSIGFVTLQSEKQIMAGKQVRALMEVDVREISLVTFACNPESKIESIKSAVDNNESITPRMVQKALQESGLSKRQAEKAINKMQSPSDSEMESKMTEQIKPNEELSGGDELKAEENKNEVKAKTPVAEVKSGDNLETKSSYYMERCLEDKIVSIQCLMDVFYYLPPTTHAAMLELAEAGRLEQRVALNLDEEEKSSTVKTEIKSEGEEVKTEVKTEVKLEGELCTGNEDTGPEEKAKEKTKVDEVKSSNLTEEEIRNWFNEE